MDDLSIHAESYMKLFHDYGMEISDKQKSELTWKTPYEKMRSIFGEHLSKKEIDNLLKEKERYYLELAVKKMSYHQTFQKRWMRFRRDTRLP